jgi:transcriptional regulator with XRE-family HTH domain
MNRIKKLRLEKGLKQSELAEMLKVAQNTLSYWENGRFEPDQKSLIFMKDYFGVTIDYLLGISETPKPELAIPDEIKGAKVAFNRGEFEGLTQEEVNRIAEFASFIKSQRKGE